MKRSQGYFDLALLLTGLLCLVVFHLIVSLMPKRVPAAPLEPAPVELSTTTEVMP